MDIPEEHTAASTFLFSQATGMVAAYRHLTTATRVKPPAPQSALRRLNPFYLLRSQNIRQNFPRSAFYASALALPMYIGRGK